MSLPCKLRGGPAYGKAPVAGFISENNVDKAFRVGVRSFVDTKAVGTEIPISPARTLISYYFIKEMFHTPGQTFLSNL